MYVYIRMLLCCVDIVYIYSNYIFSDKYNANNIYSETQTIMLTKQQKPIKYLVILLIPRIETCILYNDDNEVSSIF